MNDVNLKAATGAKAEAVIGAALALGEGIKALGSIPSGELYARLMGRLSLENYEYLIGLLVAAGSVRRDASHMLTWVGR